MLNMRGTLSICFLGLGNKFPFIGSAMSSFGVLVTQTLATTLQAAVQANVASSRAGSASGISEVHSGLLVCSLSQ